MKKTSQHMKKMRILIPLLFLALAALCLSLFYEVFAGRMTVNTDDEEVVTVLELVYAYQNPQWNTAIENVIEEFEETHPDIVIHYDVNYEDTVYEELLTRRVARGELGDIVQLKTPEAYAAGGLLGEISEEVSSLVSSVYTYEGTMYGVGAVDSTWGILYNKTLFEEYGLEEPETYDDFLQICKTLKRKGVTPIGVGGADLWHMEYWVNHFFHTDVLTVEADWLEKCSLGEVSWTDAAPTAMMNHLYSLFEKGYVNENWLTTTDTSLSYKMSEGEVALLYTGPWTAAAIEQLNPDMELGWFYVPDESGIVYATDNLDTFWSVTAECAVDEKKYEAAMTFLSWFYSDEIYLSFCETSCTFPLTDLEPDFETGSVYEEVWEAFQSADERVSVYIGNEDTPEDFEKSMLETLQDILSGTVSAEDGLLEIQRLWERSGGGTS
ncbi:MAG: ABC transporter substrate-binding protein [Lachnospiraceae bacterium]|nr:ABC transporter substrate-binding protein [Lachnospiraceae bacterium]